MCLRPVPRDRSPGPCLPHCVPSVRTVSLRRGSTFPLSLPPEAARSPPHTPRPCSGLTVFLSVPLTGTRAPTSCSVRRLSSPVCPRGGHGTAEGVAAAHQVLLVRGRCGWKVFLLCSFSSFSPSRAKQKWFISVNPVPWIRFLSMKDTSALKSVDSLWGPRS